MTKDEELKEARGWVEQKDLEGDLSFTYRDLAELCIAYHHHRLETAWVSVKERPKKTGKYNVIVDFVCPEDGSGGLYSDCIMFNTVLGWEREDVILWQPLPEPPKEK